MTSTAKFYCQYESSFKQVKQEVGWLSIGNLSIFSIFPNGYVENSSSCTDNISIMFLSTFDSIILSIEFKIVQIEKKTIESK
jgi:hypothetical protein